MTLNGAIMQLVELSEHPMMPAIFRPAIQKVIETISELEENPEPHWIPVTERLPETDGYGHYFLVCLENGVVRIDGFSRIHTTRCPDGFYYETEHFTWRQDQNKVIAWMPLPEPMRMEVRQSVNGLRNV